MIDSPGVIFNVETWKALFAFGSMSAKQDKTTMPFAYKIHGQVYHTVNLAAQPDANEKPPVPFER